MSLTPFKVLIAEDERLQLNHLADMIPKVCDGFQVVACAQTGLQALEQAQWHMPDLIITDIQMPQMGGIELIESLRDRLPGTKFIIISGYSDFEYAQRAITLRVAAYLLKPVEGQELADALHATRAELQAQSRAYEGAFDGEMGFGSPDQVAQMLKAYLDEHYGEDINLNLIASHLGYSPSHLTKVFARSCDMSPIRYLTGVRMSKARKFLLHRPDLSVREIGEMVGYEDQGYFSRMFKKNHGQSPVEFRGDSSRSYEA